MDGFHYYDLFATKGYEYLFTIVFFLLLIPVWKLLNGKVPAMSTVKSAIGTLSLNKLTIPQGIFFNTNHTWAFLNSNGVAKAGVDDFLARTLGDCSLEPAVAPGANIRKGDLMARAVKNGKALDIFAPVSGKVLNSKAHENDYSAKELYQNGWLLEIEPTNWISETNSFFMGKETSEWMQNELTRFKDFVAQSLQKYAPAPSMTVLQDGGEIREQVLQELPGEAWKDFQKTFLEEHPD